MIPGFVRLSVTGEQRERFLNLCKGRGIMLRRIVQTGEKELLLKKHNGSGGRRESGIPR